MPLQLEGRVEEQEEPLRRALERSLSRVSELAGEVEKWRDKYEDLHESAVKNEAALRSLRIKLEPLYTSLQMVFGDLDVVSEGPPAVFGGTATATQHSSSWDKWKQKMPGKPAAVIEALQSHPMTRGQVRLATNSGWSTIDAVLAKLRGLGLVDKVGDKWTLKQL